MSEGSALSVSANGVRLVLAPGEAASIAADGTIARGRIIGGVVDQERPSRDAAHIHDGDGCWAVETQPGGSVFIGESAIVRLLIGRHVEVTVGAMSGPAVRLDPAISDVAEPRPDQARLPPPALPLPQSSVPVAAKSLVVRGLTVETSGHRRLDGVDLTLESGSLLAVLGTSGAGKSTLLKTITGAEPATAGRVALGDRDLYEHFAELRHRIGYVPQDDILHPQLTVRETLGFAARLRFPADQPEQPRIARIEEVITQLGLRLRADARVDQLSGGQRKRVNVAVELLTRPELLILDEPTSGLDPGTERSLMGLLRQLADEGRMVMVVTHSMATLPVCDDVLFLARGGVPVYHGPPDGLAAHVGAGQLADVFSVVDDLEDPGAARVAKAPAAEAVRHARTREPRPSILDQIRRSDAREIGRQFRIQTERYVKVLASDRRSLLVLALQAPVMAVLMIGVFGSDHLRTNGVLRPEAGNVLMALVLASIYLGASNAVREIVKERAILRREQNFGLSVTAYLGSKVAVLGSVTVAQAGLLVVLGTGRQGGPSEGVWFVPAKIELVALVVVCGLSALCLGLLISASVNSPDKAMTLLPVMLFAQFLMAGLIFPVATPGIQQLSWLTAARWGFAGAASTADFWTLRGCFGGTGTADCSVLWKQEAGSWTLSYTMLCVLGLAALALAWRAIVRMDPAEILRKADRVG